MLTIFLRITLVFCHIFIQVLWIATSRGRNVESFIKTWTHIRSIPIVIFQLIAFVQILFLPYLAFLMTHERIPTIEVLGFLIALVGTLLASWAKIVMGTSWGRPAQHDKDKQSALVMSGPFTYTRNPIYIGLFLLFIGQQIALRSFLILLAPLFILAIARAVTVEEKLLALHFGNAYIKYQSRIPRFL